MLVVRLAEERSVHFVAPGLSWLCSLPGIYIIPPQH